MSTWTSLLIDGFGRNHETLHDVVGPLNAEALAWRPAPDANPIGWLAWHLSRVQDDHLAALVKRPQVWESWRDRFELPYPATDTGYGQSTSDVAAFTANDASLLLGYLDAVTEFTGDVLEAIADRSLDEVVDTRWDPPVTLGVRLVSVLNDTTQHAGQIAYIAGLYAEGE